MRPSPRRAAAISLAALLAVLPARIAFAVDPTLQPIAAVADTYPATEDEALVIAAPVGVLANDNPGPDTCVVAIDTTGLLGTVVMSPNGSFTYTPPANFHGQTSFAYQIVDVGPCAEQAANSAATVTIDVASVNDAPTATADSFIVLKDRTLNVGKPGVLLNDHDVDGDLLTAVPVTNAAHGVVILAADGSFGYTPASGYTGPDAFSYSASDGPGHEPHPRRDAHGHRGTPGPNTHAGPDARPDGGAHPVPGGHRGTVTDGGAVGIRRTRCFRGRHAPANGRAGRDPGAHRRPRVDGW